MVRAFLENAMKKNVSERAEAVQTFKVRVTTKSQPLKKYSVRLLSADTHTSPALRVSIPFKTGD